MPLILGTNSIKDTGYEVANSCRFNSGDDCKISRTSPNSSPTNIDKFTFSCWVKRSTLGTDSQIFDTYNGSSGGQFQMYFKSDDTLRVQVWNSSNKAEFIPNRKFRDVSAWMNIIFVYDSTPSTPSSSSIKLFINGIQETSFATETYPSQNTDGEFAIQNHIQMIGTNAGNSTDFGGYMAEVIGVDGQALAHTQFGEFDEDSPTIWKPIDVSSINVGTLGFYLDFEDSGTLGNDVSGVGDFTLANLAATDQATDTPTNNFATLNPLAPANINSASEGNLKIVQSSSGGSAISTIGFGSGKWYWEIEIDSQVTYTQLAGVIKESQMAAALLTSFNVGANSGGWGYFLQSNTDNGKAFHNNSASSAYTTVSNGDILSIAVDADNGKIYFGVNGTWVNSGNPASGSNEVYSGLPTDEIIFPAITNYLGTGSGTPTMLMNFGNPPFSISSSNADANGYGNFEYAVPSGYYCLNSANLAEFG